MSVAAWLQGLRDRHLPAGSLRLRLVGGAAWSMAATVVAQGSTLVASLLAARILGADDYGRLAMVNATTGMLGIFAGLGLGLTATKAAAELRGSDAPRLARILALLDRCVLVSGVGVTLLMVAFAPVLATTVLGAPELAPLLRVGALMLLFNEIAGVQTGVLAGFESFRDVARIAVVRAAGTIALGTAGALVAGLNGAVVGLVLASAITVVFSRARQSRVIRMARLPRATGSLWAEAPILWQFALPAFIASALVGPVSWFGSAVLVNQPDGFAQLGIFNAAYQWRNPILLTAAVMGQTSMPIMASLTSAADSVRLRKVLFGAIGSSAAVAGPIAVILILARDFVMGLYGPEFAASGDVLAVVAVAVFIMAVQGPVGQLLAASGRMWLGAMMNLAWAAVFLVSAVILVPSGGGALGLAWAYLVAYLAHTVWTAVAARFVLQSVRRQALLDGGSFHPQ